MDGNDRSASGMIGTEDRQGLLEYGLSAQTGLSDFSGDLLDQMRKAKTGDVESPLERLLTVVRSADIGDRTGRRQQRHIKKTLLGYAKTDREVFHLEMELDALRSELLRDIVRLGKLKEKNQAHQQALEKLIEEGDRAVRTVSEAHLKDINHPVHILEKRVSDLKLARMISLQMTPQLDLIIRSSQILVDKIQTSLLTTIPLWRSQMTIAAALDRQKDAAEIEQMAFSDAAGTLSANNHILRAELERLKSGGSSEALDRLKQTGAELIRTIDECREISSQSTADITQAEAEILQAKNEMKEI